MLKRILSVVCCATLPLACAVEPSPGPGEGGERLAESDAQLVARDGGRLELRDGELSFGGRGQVAELKLPNGSTLHFVEFDEQNIAVLEAQSPHAAGIDSVTDLPADASVADVFYAFSEPGTALPSRLSKAAPRSRDARAQGWARAQLTQSSALSTGNCNDSSFQSTVNSFGYNDRGTPDFRLNQSPGTSGHFEVDHNYAPGNGQSYTFYEYSVGGNAGSVWSNVDRYYSRVAVCAIDSFETENPGDDAHPYISYQGYVNNHMGPVVTMNYRRPGETIWTQAIAKDFAANEAGSVLSWHFYTGANFDWQTRIYWAGADDSFDIGHAVADLGL
jgi:hypothetical protein